MRCPCCLSDKLEEKQNTQCCEECGASFEIVNPPQDVLLKERQDFINKVGKLE